jgi:hypothetical protein
MDYEEFFPDPFIEGGWFVFKRSERLFPWQAAHISKESISPASRHLTKFKALKWVEEEIQKRLEPQEFDQWAVDNHMWTSQIYAATQELDTQITLKRLTYDWAPLNKALEEAQ